MKKLINMIGFAGACLLPNIALADWSGIYAGVSGGSTVKNELRSNDKDLPNLDIDNSRLLGAFIGTQAQRGNLVYGGEFAFSTALNAETDDNDNVDVNIYDVKARVGYAFDNVMAYSVIGLSNIDARQGSGDYDGLGANFGVGADYRVGENFILGAEYLVRRARGGNGDSIDFDVNGLTIRASYKF